MKTNVLMLLCLTVAGTTFAQNAATTAAPANGEQRGEQRAEQRLERLTTLLDLTDTQKTQVKIVLDAERAKMREQFAAARASGTRPSFEQMRAAHEQIRTETVQQLTPVLNATQLKKFEVLMAEDRGPGFGPRGHGSPGGPSSDATSPN